MKKFTHLDQNQNPQMVDVGAKTATKRTAIAETTMKVDESILTLFEDGDIKTKKGSVFHTAIIAGIMAVKNTSQLIPMCHPLQIDKANVDIQLSEEGNIIIQCEVALTGKTGVEMEALTGASVAALTVYDMCKSISHNIEIKNTRLLKKTGGKSDINVE